MALSGRDAIAGRPGAPVGRWVAGATVLLVAWACSVPTDESEPVVVRFEMASSDGSDVGEVSVSGLARERLRALERSEPDDEIWRRIFPVQVGESPGDQPTLLGDYRIEHRRVYFRPRFPFVRDETYHARWIDPDSGAELSRARLRLEAPEAGGAEPRVVAIYPSAEILPENLLRFYVQFSAPMSRERAAHHIRLVGADGPVELPFVAPEHELWNPTRDRLTLVIDPGRVKRGVGPNLDRGPVLTEGGAFQLEVGAGWPDGRGQETTEPFVKAFRVGPADRTSPRPADWELYPPDTPSAPLRLRFDAPLDRALLASAIRVETETGGAVDGRVEIGDDERLWSFSPLAPWPSVGLRVVVDDLLEDPSGNRIDRLFDESMGSGVGTRATGPVVLQFAVRPALRG